MVSHVNCILWLLTFIRTASTLQGGYNHQTTTPPTFGIRLRSSKTNPIRHSVVIRLPPTGDTMLCPAKTISYLVTRPYLFYPQSPLLQWSSGQPVDRQSLNNATKVLAWNAGLNKDHFSTHSFRIGAAMTASAAGIPDCLTRRLGRRSSDAYQLYVWTPDSTLEQVP